MKRQTEGATNITDFIPSTWTPKTHSQLAVKFQIEKRVQDPLYIRTVDANVTITDIDGRPFMYEFISQLVVMVSYVDDVSICETKASG